MEYRVWPFRHVQPKDFVSTYLRERDAIRSDAMLRAFIRRWHLVWTYPAVPWVAAIIDRRDRAWLRGTLPKRLMKALRQLREGRFDPSNRNHRIAAHIMLPAALANLTVVAQRYGVPVSTAIEQFFGVYEPNPYAGDEDLP